MNRGKRNRRLIRCDRIAIVTEGIKRDGGSDELGGGRIEDRIVLIENAEEARDRGLRSGLGVFYLAITKSSVVSPGPIKEFVPSDTDRAQKGISLVVKQAVPKLSQTSA